MTTMREQIKKHAPDFVKKSVDLLRKILAYPGLEEVALVDYHFIPENNRKMRLNLIIPRLSLSWAFGGVVTGLELFIQAAREIGRNQDIDLRVIVDSPEEVASETALTRLKDTIDFDIDSIDIVRADQVQRKITVRENDIFISFNWYIMLNISKIVKMQTEHFKCSPRPIVYLIQDYEPFFYEFSSAQLLAFEAIDMNWPIYGVYNSSSLFNFVIAQGHKLKKSYVFEPRLSLKMHPYLNGLGKNIRSKQILIYGRSDIPRNCFSILRMGLQEWARKYPEFSDWTVISAGTPHKQIPLDGKRSIRSVGKLSLDDYALLLRDTAVGISLMASPHPSYPPLEMAHFGLLTITNRYKGKNLETMHENIISLSDPMPETLADKLAEVCHMFNKDPQKGVRGRSKMPAYLSIGDFECVKPLANDLIKVVKTTSKAN